MPSVLTSSGCDPAGPQTAVVNTANTQHAFADILEPMTTISTADARFAPAGMESLHGFKILAVNVGFTKLQLTQGGHRGGQVLSVD